MKVPSFLLLCGVLAVSWVQFAGANPTTRVGFGESCNSTRKCSSRDRLTCRNSVCGCVKPEIMMFESRAELSAPMIALIGSGKCSVKAGESCKHVIGDDEDGKPLYDYFPCVQNSVCDSDGFCVCNPAFYENNNGTCSKYQGYLQQCNDNLKCSKEFQCIENACKCESARSVYDFRLGQCVGLAGGPCFNSTCVENSVCVNNTCRCKEGFFKNIQNLCSRQVEYGGKCSVDEHCAKDEYSAAKLVCVSGKCGCDPEKYVYGEVERSNFHNTRQNSWHGYSGGKYSMCAPKATHPCGNGFCAPNSYCMYDVNYHYTSLPEGSTYQGNCSCTSGTSLSKSTGLCGKSYDHHCSGQGQCAEGLLCNNNYNNRCRCKYSVQTYSSSKGRCESEINGPCVEDEDCGSFAECKIKLGRSTGHCVCKAGFTPDGDKGCKRGFNTTCTYQSEECDSLAGLQCIDAICRCQGFETYSEKLEKCVGLVGAKCRVGQAEIQCTDQASCIYVRRPTRRDVQGYCTCNKGFVETDDYKCEKPEDEDVDVTRADTGFSEGGEGDATEASPSTENPDSLDDDTTHGETAY